MTNFKTPLRGQQELTLLGSEKTTSSLVVFICKEKTEETNRLREGGLPQNRDEKLLLPHAEHDTLYLLQEADVSATEKISIICEGESNKVYPLSRTFLSNRQTVTVTFPADNFLFPIGCMK